MSPRPSKKRRSELTLAARAGRVLAYIVMRGHREAGYEVRSYGHDVRQACRFVTVHCKWCRAAWTIALWDHVVYQMSAEELKAHIEGRIKEITDRHDGGHPCGVDRR